MPKKGRRCSKLSEARNRFKEEAHEVENSNSNSERFNEVEIRIVKLKTENTEHNRSWRSREQSFQKKKKLLTEEAINKMMESKVNINHGTSRYQEFKLMMII